jgi:hypothetical protein
MRVSTINDTRVRVDITNLLEFVIEVRMIELGFHEKNNARLMTLQELLECSDCRGFPKPSAIPR